jgi:F-type H+-transporting ATPase subunit b
MLLWQLVIIQVITFGLLIFILRRFFHRQAAQSLGRLQGLYQENLKREEELERRRDEMDLELKAKVAQHGEELKRLRAEAEATAQQIQDDVLTKAREDARRIMGEAENKTERLKTNLVREMEDKALGLAASIIEHLFTAPVARGIHQHLVDELVEEIGGSDGHRLPPAVETAEIVVRFPLTEPQKAQIIRMLSSKMGRPVSI